MSGLLNVGKEIRAAHSNDDDVKNVTDNYVAYFDKNKGSEENREENYKTVVDSYYSLVTQFYEWGWGESFHFGRRFSGEPLEASIQRAEYWLALQLGLKPGMKVLDMGCGVGGPARNIARFSGAHVTGITINKYQVERGRSHTKAKNLASQVSHVQGDFMNLPFEEGSFDRIYAIEATCHAPSKVGVYGQAFKALKPGGLFAFYEWVMTEKYDPNNEEHRAIKLGIEEGDGIPNLETIEVTLAAVKEAGFELVENVDRAIGSEVPWYQPLAPQWTISGFRLTPVGQHITGTFVNVLEKIYLAPPGSKKTHDFLIVAAKNLLRGAQLGIFTPMFFVLARKPE